MISPRLLSWRGVEFCQRLFQHLMRWWCVFFLSVYVVDHRILCVANGSVCGLLTTVSIHLGFFTLSFSCITRDWTDPEQTSKRNANNWTVHRCWRRCCVVPVPCCTKHGVWQKPVQLQRHHCPCPAPTLRYHLCLLMRKESINTICLVMSLVS